MHAYVCHGSGIANERFSNLVRPVSRGRLLLMVRAQGSCDSTLATIHRHLLVCALILQRHQRSDSSMPVKLLAIFDFSPPSGDESCGFTSLQMAGSRPLIPLREDTILYVQAGNHKEHGKKSVADYSGFEINQRSKHFRGDG